MGRMAKKQLRKEKNIKVTYILLAIFILLIVGLSLVDKTIGHITGNNDIRAIDIEVENDIAIVHFLGNEYDIDYVDIAVEIRSKLEEAYEVTLDNIIAIKERILSINVGG
ncbi:hypothetical protein EDD79_1001243 [Serpentinicella alkaliphila]|uniref:Uncharacterized protein n=2 Tax=Serpentinicella alkaliphila TaxID=1734049 RepID=A0A4V2T583_9FIRM|nr:hypothetical protein EDD79_1001243 [Serpentinicella alkaliphila]